jgi:hypothetical protein
MPKGGEVRARDYIIKNRTLFFVSPQKWGVEDEDFAGSRKIFYGSFKINRL